MIVKVQLPLSRGGDPALIYNESREVMTMVDISADLLEAMDGEMKKFFHAKLSKKNGEREIELLDEAPWQDW